jgi:ABC-type multidrug transport system fused ATPase/permease subunit
MINMIETVKKIFELLTPEERRRTYILFMAILVMAFMETVGVASILPFISVLANPAVILNNRYLSGVYKGLNFSGENNFLIFLGGVVLVAMVVSNVFTVLISWGLLRFTYGRDYTLGRRLLEEYVRRPYAFFLERNSSDLGKNLLSEVSIVVSGVFVPGMLLLSKIIVTLFLICALFIANPLLTLTLSVCLGSAYAFAYVLVRKKLETCGKIRQKTDYERFRVSAELFGGIKEITLLGREDEFIERYTTASKNNAKVYVAMQMIGQTPRYAMETLAFGGIMFVILYYLIVKGGIGSVLPTIALFALAGYRLMPVLQQMFRMMTDSSFHLPAINVLYNDLIAGRGYERSSDVQENSGRIQNVDFACRIDLSSVSFKYRSADVHAVKDVSLFIEKNSTIGLVGATGSGKTTLVDLIMGLLEPTTGRISIDGVKISHDNMKAWQRKIGYVPQQIFLADATIRENIAFGVPEKLIDDDAVEKAATIANIHDFTNGLNKGYQTVIGERGVRLSGGQRQRIGIARALYHDPDVLIMDEATSALDGITEDVVIKAIDNLSHKKTIILIAHRFTTVKGCDAIYLMENGTIVSSGSYYELLDNCPKFRAMSKLDLQPMNEEMVNG